MKRNIVILLCLVFFTQTAFTDWNFWCDDCQDERIACRRELRTCYQDNDRCQEQLRNESAQIKELKARNVELEAQNLKLKVGWGAEAIGSIVLACILRPYRAIRDLIVRATRSGYVNKGTDPEVGDQAVLVDDQA